MLWSRSSWDTSIRRRHPFQPQTEKTAEASTDHGATARAVGADPEAVDGDEPDDGRIVAVGDRRAQRERDRRGAHKWSTGAAAVGQTSPDELSGNHPHDGGLPFFVRECAAEFLCARR